MLPKLSSAETSSRILYSGAAILILNIIAAAIRIALNLNDGYAVVGIALQTLIILYPIALITALGVGIFIKVKSYYCIILSIFLNSPVIIILSLYPEIFN